MSSVIGAGTSVHGNIEGEGSLEILGRVEGNVVMTGDVTVGEGGAVLGDVSATQISVQGAVKGNLRGAEAVMLARPARVVGDISAPRIGIGAGALVRGNVRTEGEAMTPNKRTTTAAPFKAPGFAPKPVAKAEPKLPPLPPEADDADEDEDEDADAADNAEAVTPGPARPSREIERRPPPPVLPSLGKGARAKKKKGRDE